MNFVTTALAALALAISITLAFVSVGTISRLEQIDQRLDGIQSELTTIQSPSFMDKRLDQALDRAMFAMRQDQLQRMAKSQ